MNGKGAGRSVTDSELPASIIQPTNSVWRQLNLSPPLAIAPSHPSPVVAQQSEQSTPPQPLAGAEP